MNMNFIYFYEHFMGLIVAIYKYAKREERRGSTGGFCISSYYIYSWKSGINKYFIIHPLTWGAMLEH